MNKWVGVAIAAVSAAAGLLVWVGGISADQGQIKNKVRNLEQRQAEDRKDTREAISEVKEHVRIIDRNTQLILQEVRSMQAVNAAERRERR